MKKRMISVLIVAVMFLGILPNILSAGFDNDPAADDPFGDQTKTSVSVTTTTQKSIGKTISGLKLTLTSLNSVKLTWNEVSGAEYYQIYRTDGTKAISFYKRVTLNSFVDKKLTRGKTYSYQVKAFSSTLEQSSNFSSKVKTTVFPTKISLVKATAKAKSIVLTVKEVSGAQKYQVVYSKNKNFKNAKTETVKSNKITVKSLKNNTKYYFKVRAVKKVAKKNYYTKYYKLNKKTKK